MSDILTQIVLGVFAVGLAIIPHELAHGYAALALGDDTARAAGRLSLNPLRHVDRVGTILLPGFLLISQLLLPPHQVRFMFGWAKPVPIGNWKFRDPRRGMALVAAAGPLMNFFLAWVGALLMPVPSGPLPAGIDPLDAAVAQHPLIGLFLFYFILTNLVLGLFNLLPIPPLDGGRIAVGVLPLPLAQRWARLERAGIVVVILLIFVLPLLLGQFGIAFDPFRAALETVVPWAFHILFLLSGHGASLGQAVQHV
ncbi:MAG TPA: site-2 protease family protein [Acetobacteraceae bacterium]|nr:site-2 protease family protein [Acetobacteraceae bacterium]